MEIPNLCDRILYDGHTYRVNGYLKTVTFAIAPFAINGVNIVDATTVTRQVFCSREEAELVTAVGVCGVQIPVNEAVVVGRVEWTDAQIACEKADYALFMGLFVF
jgi:hypothetical protein